MSVVCPSDQVERKSKHRPSSSTVRAAKPETSHRPRSAVEPRRRPQSASVGRGLSRASRQSQLTKELLNLLRPEQREIVLARAKQKDVEPLPIDCEDMSLLTGRKVSWSPCARPCHGGLLLIAFS